MTDAQISAALDPEGRIVPIEAAHHRANYYRCPECGNYLTVRKGSIRKPHFAHAPGTMQEHDCRLGTETGVREMQIEHRKSNTEKSELKRQIRLFIGESYGSTVRLTGVLPTLNWEDLDDPAGIDSALENVNVTSKGTTESPQPTWFHPSEPEVEFGLDPRAEQYVTLVETNDMFDKIEGRWVAEGLATGEVFVGEPNKSERWTGKSDPLISEGDWVYIIIEEMPVRKAEGIKKYEIGPWKIVGFEVDKDTRPLLQKYAGVKETDQYGFNADILLPPETNPRTEAPIYGQPKQEALVAVTPPEEVDPTFEVVSVPASDGEAVELERTGPGQPRFFKPRFPEQEGSRRLSIHWTSRHRVIHLHSQESEDEPKQPWMDESKLGVRVKTDSGSIFLNPLSEEDSVTVHMHDGSVTEILSFEGPEGYRVDLEGEFPATADFPSFLHREEVSFEDALREIFTWQQEECQLVRIILPSLGRVEIELEEMKPWERERSKDEIKEQLREMDELPNKARWPLVREICNAPKGTPHSEFPGGIKKTVRHAFMEVREERRGD